MKINAQGKKRKENIRRGGWKIEIYRDYIGLDWPRLYYKTVIPLYITWD